jgi:hypothetical protein
MKAIIQDGKIYNFVDDSYISGNKDIIPAKIKGFADGVDMEEVNQNKTRIDFGFFQYYLDDKGIVQKLGKGDAEYDEAYTAHQRKQREVEYKAKVDSLTLEKIRLQLNDAEINSLVTAVKDKYPY